MIVCPYRKEHDAPEHLRLTRGLLINKTEGRKVDPMNTERNRRILAAITGGMPVLEAATKWRLSRSMIRDIINEGEI